MPLKIKKRGEVYHYSGTVAGQRLRGTTGTAIKEIAQQIAAREEARAWKCDLHGPEAVLTFADAAVLYRRGGKPTRFLDRVEDHWKDTLVTDIKPGNIRQAAIDAYPKAAPQTRNRQFIVPTQAIINHAAELELCPFIKVKRFKFEKKIKDPFTVEWLDTFCAHASPRLKGLAIFMFVTGARVSEALRVQWDDLDLRAQTVMIRKTKSGPRVGDTLAAELTDVHVRYAEDCEAIRDEAQHREDVVQARIATLEAEAKVLSDVIASAR